MNTSLLTPYEFDEHVARRTLRISLVGMSNAGKSRRAHTLAEDCGFSWYQVDQDIARACQLENVGAVGAWMGYPSAPGYREREQRYLTLEAWFTDRAAMSSEGRNLVFDTTGSVVHLPASTLETLREHTLVVHLDVGEEALADLLARFFKDPKPVCWGAWWNKQEEESDTAAIQRSYPALLSARLARYRALAHVAIPARELWDAQGGAILAHIREALARAA